MKEVPFLMSTLMVQAILAGRKTQTRRVISPGKSGICYISKKLLDWNTVYPNYPFGVKLPELANPDLLWNVPPMALPGDLIWVRENIYCHPVYNATDAKKGWCGGLFDADGNAVAFRGYCADEGYVNPEGKIWKVIPSIHMPKSAARIWLRCTDVCAERAQDITEADAIAEGIEPVDEFLYRNYMDDSLAWIEPVNSFKSLWLSINDKAPKQGEVDGRWDANPWVWAYTFEVVSTTGKPMITL